MTRGLKAYLVRLLLPGSYWKISAAILCTAGFFTVCGIWRWIFPALFLLFWAVYSGIYFFRFGIGVTRETFRFDGRTYKVVDLKFLFAGARNYRMLKVEGGIASRKPLGKKSNDYLFSGFFDQLLQMRDGTNANIINALILGGAGCSIPHQLLHANYASRVDVVEISAGMIEIYRKYFCDGDERIHLHHADAVEFVAECADSTKYDLIVSDIFRDSELAADCYTPEYLRNISRLLTAHGLAVFNLGWKNFPVMHRCANLIAETFLFMETVLEKNSTLAIASNTAFESPLKR